MHETSPSSLRSQSFQEALKRAIDTMFVSLGTRTAPSALPYPPSAWTTPYRAIALATGIAPEIAAGHAAAARLLDLILSGTAPDSARWHAEAGLWNNHLIRNPVDQCLMSGEHPHPNPSPRAMGEGLG